MSIGLDEKISDKDRTHIAQKLIIKWEPLRSHLGLDRQQEEEICRSWPKDYQKQKVECLEVWSQKKGDEATYSALIKAAEDTANKQLADEVKKMLRTRPTSHFVGRLLFALLLCRGVTFISRAANHYQHCFINPYYSCVQQRTM